ncbi:MAG: UDP-3-O-(3-hydroxymyristoyl)glucosamine N-acyltransferase [Candidatus Firestonebacteria bacterium RIFOXYA2_FULL_40_8]|nr:MAG: UDP-3-O-(3-hydroxymyristoyl)glucosamine N-acyltransferase [Candidatus Firestonebacteria bacterium RIFOXYA2_FULL_40_8]
MLTLSDIANLTGGKLSGEGGIYIYRVAELADARDGDISFVAEEKYIKDAELSKAGALIIKEGLSVPGKSTVTVVNPHYAIARIMEKLYIKETPVKGIHSSAIVSIKAKIGNSSSILPYVIIEDGAEIGENTVLYPFVYVGKNARIGANTVIYPNVTIREEVLIGNNVIIHAGAVIGSDGFGYTKKEDRTFYKIPQIGTVVVEDYVEIGACACIDRAMLSETRIKKGTKIDNLVQVGHNAVIGENCILAGQSGLGGSAKLGSGVILAGQAGVADHVDVGENAFILAQAGVSKSLEANKVYVGSPAEEARQFWKTLVETKKIGEMNSRLKVLEQRFKEIEEYLKGQIKK